MLAAALRRNACHRSFHDFQQRLLHTFARHVAGNRGIVGLARDFVDLVDVDDAALRPLDVVIPSRDFTSEDLFSSRMMSMQSSTHSSQIKTVGPAISLRTSCWLLPQNEQYNVFFESLAPTLLILFSVRRSPSVCARGAQTN